MKSRILTLLILLNFAALPNLFSQNVSINSTGSLPDTSAMLDVSSTTKGFLMPRMTTTERDAIILPATGLTIFNTTIVAYQVNTGIPVAPIWSTLNSGAGSVSSVSVTSANGLGGTVATATTTPNITLTTSVTGMVKGDGTGFSAAIPGTDYLTGNQTISFAPTGDVTGSTTGTTTIAPALVIGTNKVLNSMLAQMPALTIKGNNTGGTANALDLTVAQVNAILPVFTSTLNGLVPFGGGSAAKVLHADGTWKDTASATNQWSITGNTGTTSLTNFIGTTDYKSFKVKTNNIQGILLDSLGNVGIGTAPAFDGTNPEKFLVYTGATTSVNSIVGKGSINSYLQLNIQNQSTGTSASSDVVATANNGNETSNYIDMGINGGSNTSGVMGVMNDAYLYNLGQNLFIGTGTPAKSLIFMTGGTDSATNGRMIIDGSGNVGIGNTSPTQKLDVTGKIRFSGALMPNNLAGTSGNILTSAGAGAAPTWTAPVNQTISFAPTGDVTGSTTGTTTIAPLLAIGTNKVLNSMLAQMPTLTIKGNNTGGTANALDLTVAQVNAILPVFTSTLNGLVPLSGGSAGKVLHADGTWKDTTASTPKGIIGSLGAGYNIVGTATATYYCTGTSITLPPGKYMVFAYMMCDNTLSRNDIPGSFFVKTLFAESSYGTTAGTSSSPATNTTMVTADVVGSSKLISGSISAGQPYNPISGFVFINNTSGANKTYYYWAGWIQLTTVNNTSHLTLFGGTNYGEDNIVAFPVN